MLYLLLFLFLVLTIFCARELLRKFVFLGELAKSNTRAKTWHYDWQRKPGMYNIALRSDIQFWALVAFKLDLPLGYSWVDPFGYVTANSEGVAVVSLYLGRSPVDFVFLLNTDTTVKVSSIDTDQALTPNVIYLPHWWQRLGIFG